MRIHKPPSSRSIYNPYSSINKKKGKTIQIIDRFGNSKTITLNKSVPRYCSVPRRICIKCLKNSIHKNDLNYDIKICKDCYEGI